MHAGGEENLLPERLTVQGVKQGVACPVRYTAAPVHNKKIIYVKHFLNSWQCFCFKILTADPNPLVLLIKHNPGSTRSPYRNFELKIVNTVKLSNIICQIRYTVYMYYFFLSF